MGQPQRTKCPEWVPLGVERWELCLLVILGKTKFHTHLASPTSSSIWALTEGEMWLSGCNSNLAASGSAAPSPDPFLERWFPPRPWPAATPLFSVPPAGRPEPHRPARAGADGGRESRRTAGGALAPGAERGKRVRYRTSPTRRPVTRAPRPARPQRGGPFIRSAPPARPWSLAASARVAARPQGSQPGRVRWVGWRPPLGPVAEI